MVIATLYKDTSQWIPDGQVLMARPKRNGPAVAVVTCVCCGKVWERSYFGLKEVLWNYPTQTAFA